MIGLFWAFIAVHAVVGYQIYAHSFTVDDTLNSTTFFETFDPELFKTQINLNEVADFAVAQIVQNFQNNHAESLPVPNIDERFKVGKGIVKIKGHFQASKGRFRDLTTIHRSSDVVLTNEGLKYSAECGFGLRTAQVLFDHYKLKAGVHVSGHISAEVHNIALKAKLVVDYNARPCVASLEYLKMTEFGHPKIKMSGLGPLNHLFSKLMSWVANHWRNKISHKVEESLRNAAQQQVVKLQCEKYRPN